jgi:Na+/melibiose symporter-like transporter
LNLNTLNSTKKGILLSLLLVNTALICFYVLKMPDNGSSQYIIFFVFIAGLLLGLFQYRQLNVEAGFKQLFGEGFKIFVVVAFLLTILPVKGTLATFAFAEEEVVEAVGEG